MSADPKEQGAKDALEFLKTVDSSSENKLKYFPGSKMFGRFVEELQKRFGIDLKPEEVISTMDSGTIPGEVQDLLKQADAL